MEAYIDKNNKVVHIAPTKADEIQPNSKGKLLFTGGEYDPTTMKYTHVLGKGEEVTAVNGEGLFLGDVYVEPKEIKIDPIEQLKAEVEQEEANYLALKREAAIQYLMNSPEFEEHLNKMMEEV